MNIVAIDFSINSPGICVLKDGKPHWIGYLNAAKMSKKDKAIQDEMSRLDDVTLIFQPEPDVSKQELIRVQRHISLAEELTKLIIEHTDPSQPYKIYFEGASYGTSRFGTNSLLDLASASSIFKYKLIQDLSVVEDLEVLAPTTIKKFAGKGNMKKEDMWKVFLDNQALLNSPFWKFCQSHREDKKLVKPIDDLIDSYFILMYSLGG